MTTHNKDKIIALRDEADKFATEKLLCEGEYHPDFHTVSDERFYALAFEAGCQAERENAPLHKEGFSAGAASRDAYIERLETGLLQVRKALCGDIHNTDDLLDLIASRDAEVAELKADAQRYRWLRDNKAANNTHCWHFQTGPIIPGLLTLDASIDAVLAKVRKP